MKIQCFVPYLFVLLPLGEVFAQSKFCDELVQVGDTFICEDFIGKSIVPAREHYYLFGNLIFSRRWYYLYNGEYYCLQFRSRYKYAKRDGPARFFYANGTLKGSTVYEKGKLIGPCRSFYPNGELKHMCERHIGGALDGIEISFYETGLVKFKAKWEKGRLRQILRYKDEQGNDLPIGTFKDGNGTWIQYQNGQIFGAYVYKKGKMVAIIEDPSLCTLKE